MTEEQRKRFAANQIFPLGCRLVLGLVFLLSAALKFWSLDAFESYIFSLGFFNLTFSSFLSRCVLFAEAFLGLMLLSMLFRKWVDRAVLLLLVGFSVLLSYLLVTGNDGNCHCMGEAFSLSPGWSLLKNVALLLLLFFSSKCEITFVRRQKRWLSVFFFVSLAFAFCKLPLGWGTPRETKYNAQAYAELEQKQPELRVARASDRAVVCLFSVKCRHCKMAMRKLEVVLREATDVPVQWVVWGSEGELADFIEETGVAVRPHIFLPPVEMMPITEYNIPLLLFFRNGEVAAKMGNSTFDDEAAVKLLRK